MLLATQVPSASITPRKLLLTLHRRLGLLVVVVVIVIGVTGRLWSLKMRSIERFMLSYYGRSLHRARDHLSIPSSNPSEPLILGTVSNGSKSSPTQALPIFSTCRRRLADLCKSVYSLLEHADTGL
ncbi:MAG: hypothetical protein C4293_21935 [Nitrospiraceae bacterium]